MGRWWKLKLESLKGQKLAKLDFSESLIFFWKILRKPGVSEKSGSSIMDKNALSQSDWVWLSLSIGCGQWHLLAN